MQALISTFSLKSEGEIRAILKYTSNLIHLYRQWPSTKALLLFINGSEATAIPITLH